MAVLGSDEDRLVIANQYGGATRSLIHGGNDTKSLATMYADAVGAGAHIRSGFAGYGRPEFQQASLNASTGASTGGKIDISFTLSQVPLPTPTTVVVLVWAWTGTKTHPGSYDFTFNFNYSSAGTKNETLTLGNANANTRYYVSLKYYNHFTRESADHEYILDINIQDVYSSGPTQFPTPVINIATISSLTAPRFTVEWNYGADPSTFTAQYSINNGSWVGATYFTSQYWNTTTNPKIGLWSFLGSLSGNETSVRVRIRAEAEGNNAASEWSNAYLLEMDVAEPTNLSLTQPNAYSGSLTASWTNQESEGTYIQWQVYSGGSWSNSGSLVFVSSGSSTSKTFSDGQVVRFQAYHAVDVYGNTIISGIVNSGQLTVDILTQTTFPENFVAVENFRSNSLTWSHPDSGQPDTYNIQGYYNNQWNNVVTGYSGAQTSYTHNLVPSGLTQYRIAAIDGGVWSSWTYSNTI